MKTHSSNVPFIPLTSSVIPPNKSSSVILKVSKLCLFLVVGFCFVVYIIGTKTETIEPGKFLQLQRNQIQSRSPENRKVGVFLFELYGAEIQFTSWRCADFDAFFSPSLSLSLLYLSDTFAVVLLVDIYPILMGKLLVNICSN